MIKDEQLTLEAHRQLNCLISEKATAFNMIVNNYYKNGETDIDSNKVVTRLQTQYFALNRNENSIKTASNWSHNEYNEPNEVNLAISPLVDNKYSSFALKEVNENLELNYPLDDDFASLVQPFATKNISDSEYDAHLRVLEEKLGVTVSQNDVLTQSTYKRSFGKLAILKIKNAFLRLTKKPVEVKAVYKGKISLQSRVLGYPISNIEKITKIYDFIFKVSIAKEAKIYKNQTGEKTSKELQYAARLFANVLMSRINEFNTQENHQTLEKCLWLQFANFVNAHNLDSKQLVKVCDLGAKAVASTCKDLGITKEKIIEKMLKRGFVYNCAPADEVQALLSVNEKDFTKYSSAEQTAEKKDDKAGFVPDNTIEKNKNNNPDNTKKDEPEKPQTSVIPAPNELEKPGESLENQIKKSTIEKMVDKQIIKFCSTQGNALGDKIDAGKFKGKKLEVASAQLRFYNLVLSYYVQASNGKAMKVKNDGEYNETEISKAKLIVKGLLERRLALVDAVTSNKLPRPENQKASSYINAVCVNATNYNVREYFTKLIKGCIEYCLNEQFGKKGKQDNSDEVVSMLAEGETSNQEESTPKQLQPAQEDQNTNNLAKPETKPYTPNFVMLDENGNEQKPYVPNFVFVESKDDGIEK
ncbi:MAG: hypothetical protein E7376_01720 [Clostridiales bacterium]|nr:hypothetical protein [Clostridiales bacterium]